MSCLCCWFCFADSQGNNGRPGKPGDRGSHGPQVTDFRIKRKTQTDIWAVNMNFFLVIYNFLFVCFELQGARGFPGTPGLPGMKGHRVSVDLFLSWPELCLHGPHLKPSNLQQAAKTAPKQKKIAAEELHVGCVKCGLKCFGAFKAAPTGLTMHLPLFLSHVEQTKNKKKSLIVVI